MNIVNSFSANSKIFIIGILTIFVIITSFYLTTTIIQNFEDKEQISIPTESITSDNIQKQYNNKISLKALEILNECETDDKCVIEQLQSLSKISNQKEFMSTVNDIVSTWANSGFYCHPEAHHVGKFLLDYFDGDVVEAMLHVDNKCGNALYHGIVENYLLVQIIIDGISLEEVEITQPCVELGSSSESYKGLACAHGMGHGLNKIYDLNIFEAVKKCDQFTTKRAQEECHGGVFMQNALEFYNTGKAVFEKEDLFYPCNQMDKKYQKECYVYQSYYILYQNNLSPTITFQYCEQVPYEEAAGACFAGVGRYIANYYFFNIEKTAQVCNEANPKYQKECILAAIEMITIYVDSEIGDDFCNLVSKNHYDLCVEKWISSIEWMNNSF